MADAFHAGACLLKRGVINNEKVHVILLLGILLTDNAHEANGHGEQVQQHYYQRGGNILLLLHFQAAECSGQLKKYEENDNIWVHAILLEEYVVFLVNIL